MPPGIFFFSFPPYTNPRKYVIINKTQERRFHGEEAIYP
jgi:hypothetical protein